MNDFQTYFKKKISSSKKLNHMGNNQIFEISLNNNKKFLVKRYSRIHGNNWDRGMKEFKTLSFLWNKGFRETPKPIYFYKNDNVGVYTFEKGRILKPNEIHEEHIKKAVNFLLKIHNLDNESKKLFSPASSACLSFQDYINTIDKRLKKIISHDFCETGNENGKNFLKERIIPIIEKLKREFLMKAKEEEIDMKKELPIDEQVLTPADFGFHNILVDEKGNYKFIDFEYFGRDDPVRQILDFLHHDQSIEIDERLKKYFLDLYMRKMQKVIDIDFFKKRFRLVNGLVGITWTLIYLNVLSPNYIKHLKFAHGDVGNLIEERLIKAERKLERLRVFINF